MLNINTNLSSFIAQRSMKQSTNKLNQAIERLTTGFKINHAKDNAANYNIATNMTTQIGSLDVAEDNAMTSLDLLTTASDNLSLIQERVQRLRDLQEQACNGTYGEQALLAINAECNALVDEINRLYLGTEYNGCNLFLETSVGADGSQEILQDMVANESTKFSDLGISDCSFEVKDSSGTTLQTYDIEESDTIGDLFTTLKTHGFSTKISNGVIEINAFDGKYVTGDLMTELGINTQADTFVESTEQTSTVQVTYTTSTTTPGYTYTTGVAQTSGVLNYTVTTTTTSTETSSFINAITRRDTRYMTALSSVDPAVELADGTYKISTAAELAQLATMTNAGLVSSGDEFVLANDIDLSGYSNWTPIGETESLFNLDLAFKGIFDGNGFVVSNINIDYNKNDINYAVGFFGNISNCTIKNLGIENITVTATGSGSGNSDQKIAGSLAGNANSSTIDNCYSTGSIDNAYNIAGGLIGIATTSCNISNCYTSCDVISSYYPGGFIGAVEPWFSEEGTTITNCFATGDTTQRVDSFRSAFIACFGGKSIIRDCYATGSANYFIASYRTKASSYNIHWNNSTLNPAEKIMDYTGTIVAATTTYSTATNATMTYDTYTTSTVTATETTELSTIGLSSNNTIKVVSKADKTATTGITSTISVNGSTTIGDLISALQTAGLSASFSAGKISISASDLVYLDAISSTLSTEIGINAGAGRSWNSTTVAPVTNTFTHTLSGTTTMGNLGLTGTRNIEIKNNGATQSISINKNTTFQELDDMLHTKGFTVGLNNGIVSISADSDLYVNSSVLADLLCLGAVNKVEGATYSNLPSGNLGYTINLIDQVGNVYAPGAFTLQIGVNSDENSQITVQTAFSLGGYSDFRNIGVDGNNYLAQIDEMLEKLSARQVELGSAQNRLMSALDEITVQRENLISSRSTLRDADIADISSEYIRQQILQQASATLLSTANQSPSIALQLI